MRADEPYKNIRLLKPWVLTLYPTQGFADLEGMDSIQTHHVAEAMQYRRPEVLRRD